MKVLLLTLTLASAGQAPSPTAARQPAKGEVAGVVLNGATGDPLPGVRVTLARIDLAKTSIAEFARLVGGDPAGAPPGELSIPAEFLELRKKEAVAAQREMEDLLRGDVLKTADDAISEQMAALKNLSTDDIHSVLVNPAGKLALVSKSAPPTVSDGAGRFRFQNLEPGVYRVIFAAKGFVRQDYGRRGAQSGTPVPVEAGPPASALIMRMTPTGGLSGRLTDSAGQPLAGIPVQLLTSAYDGTGRRKAKPIAAMETNDRGEYRFYYVTPGRYTVQAGNRQLRSHLDDPFLYDPFGALTGNPARPNPNRIDERYAPVYYPGTNDPLVASQVAVPAGAEITGIDFVLPAQRSYRIRGRIIDPRTGQPPRFLSLRLMNPDGADAPGAIQSQFYDPADGSFDLRGVAAGSYVLRANLPSLNQARTGDGGLPPNFQSMSPAEQEAYFKDRQERLMAEQTTIPRIVMPITVNADVEGLTLTSLFGGRLAGIVRAESAGAREARLDQISIELRALAPDGAPTEGYDIAARVDSAVKSDGTFRLEGILPGDYVLGRSGIPRGFFLKSAMIGDTDVLNGPITMPLRDSAAGFEIVISRNTGQIDGTATSADGRPLAGAQVVLIPDANRQRYELFRSVVADSEGQFSIADVAPGDYHLTAWASLELFAYFDPAVMRQAEEYGKAVRVAESSKQTVGIRAMPADSTSD